MKTSLRSLLQHLPLVAFVTFLVACIAYPGYSVVLEQVNTTSVQTLTNKTLTAPVIGTIVNTGTLTLPTSTDTLVGRATTDTLSNKILSSPQITNPQFSGTSSGVHTYNLSTLAGSALGTYTFGGTPTIIAPAISNPTLSGGGVLGGTYTGTYTLAGTPTLSAPVLAGTATGTYTLASPILSGTATGTYTLAGTPTVSSSVNLTGGKIVFPATQAASAGATTLDDYEEGSWTPAIGGTATYNAQFGSYTKIGRLVSANFKIHINVKGTGSVTSMTGLPFAAVSTSGAVSGCFINSWSNVANTITVLVAAMNDGSATVNFDGPTAAGFSSSIGTPIFGNNTSIYGTCVYEAAT